MIHLLDANVLIALVDPSHPHHAAAVRYFPTAQKAGWATCPLVENAFIRILGHANYRNGPGSSELARQILLQYRAAPGHQFLADDVTLCDLRRFPALRGSRALTDLYLLALAVKHHARFVTFDTGIDVSLVADGRHAFHLLKP
jgi:toxin-antitoxin system PIN domain toxin